jgi:hypothetical protein
LGRRLVFKYSLNEALKRLVARKEAGSGLNRYFETRSKKEFWKQVPKKFIIFLRDKYVFNFSKLELD